MALPACRVDSVFEAMSFSVVEHTLDGAAQLRGDSGLGSPDRSKHAKDRFGRHRSNH